MDNNRQLSPHFSYNEAVYSRIADEQGISNIPSNEILDNIKTTANLLEKVRSLLSQPIHISSWFRGSALNKAVGGAKQSAHIEGWAVDFTCPKFGTPLEIVKAIEASNILFDKCIQEGRWVHISFAPSLRRKVLTAHFHNGNSSYTEGA